MKRVISAVIATAITAVSIPAYAGSNHNNHWNGGYHYGGWNNGYRYGGGWGWRWYNNQWVWALAGAAALGAALNYPYWAYPAYSQPYPLYAPQQRSCWNGYSYVWC